MKLSDAIRMLGDECRIRASIPSNHPEYDRLVGFRINSAGHDLSEGPEALGLILQAARLYCEEHGELPVG